MHNCIQLYVVSLTLIIKIYFTFIVRIEIKNKPLFVSYRSVSKFKIVYIDPVEKSWWFLWVILTYCHASSSDQYLSEQNTVKMFPVRKSIILTVQTLDRRFYRWQLGDTTNYINYRQTEVRSGFAPTFVNIWRATAAAPPPRMDTRLRNNTQPWTFHY